MPPLSIMIKPVSSACNLRCRYCFYADVAANREQASLGRMTEETLEILVRRAIRGAEGSLTLAFQGGEPTLAGVGFYKKLIELEKKYNTKGLRIQNSIQTNGCELSDELIELFAREDFLVGVSLDGTEAIHDRLRIDAAGEGSYRRVRENIARLEQRGVQFNILCVVNAYTAQQGRAVFEALAPYDFLQFIPCLDDFSGEKQDYSLTAEGYSRFLKSSFDCYYEYFKRGQYVSVRNFDNYVGMLAGRPPENCGMSGRCAQYYLVEADGSVYPCDFYVLDQWRMGNVRGSSFFSLAKSPVAERFRKASLHVDEKCRSCRWYSLCRGGCRREREPFVNGLPGLNRWCSCYEEFFEYSESRLREMAKCAAAAGK